MPPMYSASTGRIASHAASTSSPIETFTVGAMSNPPSSERRPQDLHVFPGAPELLREGLPMPALGHLRARAADAEQQPSVREDVERGRCHSGHRGRPPRHLEDARTDLYPARLRGEPR